MRAIAIAISVCVSGCSGTASYIIEQYGDATPQFHTVTPVSGQRYVDGPNGPIDTARRYLILDKPGTGKLIIQAGSSQVIGDSLARGVAGVDTSQPIMIYREAADDFLSQRGCKSTEIYPFDKYRYEVAYACAAASPEPAATAAKPKKA